MIVPLVPLAALAQDPVPVEEDPHARIRLETSEVRVVDVTVPPGEITLLHRHAHDIVFLALTTASYWTESELGQKHNEKVTAGDVWSETTFAERPRAHKIGNGGKTPLRLLGVETLAPPGFEKGPLLTGDPKGFSKVHEDENMIVYRLRLEPGETTGPHRHPRPTVLVRFPDGALQWIEEGSDHELHNPEDASSASILYAFALK